MSHDLKTVATSNGHGEDFALFCGGRNYGWTEHVSTYTTDSDYGKYRKVVVHGSCHSRCMMLESETDWLMLKQFEKARSGLLNAHRELWNYP